MVRNIFYPLTGGNDAIYIINLSTFKDITVSLEFYKPVSMSRRILKNGIYLYLCFISILPKSFLNKKLRCIDGVRNLIMEKVDRAVKINIDASCSIFISSGRDKIIVHNHHCKYYEKYAFNGSYEKSANEIDIYNILRSYSAKHYLTSEIQDIHNYGSHCSFKLYNEFDSDKRGDITDVILVDALVELFEVTPSVTKNISEICSQIREGFTLSVARTRSIAHSILAKIDSIAGESQIRLGLVHGDFKIWNVQSYINKIHIYDFEESKLDGLPLDDLYNYYIDPMIMTGESINDILAFVKGECLQKQSALYLHQLSLNTSHQLLLLFYLINRLHFYDKNGSEHIAQRIFQILTDLERDIFQKINLEIK